MTQELAAPQPATPRPAPTAPRGRRRGKPFWLAVGLVLGLLIGLGLGYLIFNGKKISVQTLPSSSSQTAAPSAVTTASATATAVEPAVQTAAPVAQGVVACPVATPLGQHQMGAPGSPGQGQSESASLDFCGGGNATIPAGAARFTTSAGWGLGIADSCPVGSSGEAGTGTVLTVNEVIPGGGHGPDTATETGDSVDGSTTQMATGGNYQLQVTTVSPSCVWQVNIYPT